MAWVGHGAGMAVRWTARVWRAVETCIDASGWLLQAVRTTEAMGWVGGMLVGVEGETD